MYCACCLFCFTSGKFCCGKSAGHNLLVNQPCCHSEQLAPLYYIAYVLLLILFVILNVVIFSLRATTLIKSESGSELSLLFLVGREMGTGQGAAAVLCGWEGNRRSNNIAMIIHHRLSGMSTY